MFRKIEEEEESKTKERETMAKVQAKDVENLIMKHISLYNEYTLTI